LRRADVQDEVIYRCVNGACARPLPRRVNYCPYCGISQGSGLPRPNDPAAGPAVSIAKPAAAPFVPAPPVAAAAPAARPPPASPPPPRSAEPPRNPAPPGSPEPARPPQREPVRLRYWLLALGVLWLIWITQRPSTTLIDARINGAVAMAAACKSSEAQAELIALRSSKATPAQLQRLQSALNDADAACNRRNGRAKQAPRTARPPASGQAQSARNLIADARQALAAGAYKAASEKMEVCAAMVDAGNRECSALKSRADRLQGEMERCLAGGREWVGDRCQ
jgi:hypothetical protein